MNVRRASLLFWILFLLAIAGCSSTVPRVLNYVLLPEQRVLPIRDPAQLPPAPIPPMPSPRTVTDTQPQTREWRLSLDQAIQIALQNANVIRILTGISAVSSGRTIYDVAITNTTIDVEQARFDPFLEQRNVFNRFESPQAILDPFQPDLAQILGSTVDGYRGDLLLSKRNVLGGQWALNWFVNPQRLGSDLLTNVFPLNPQTTSAFEMSYTQPLLQGGGFLVNMAPIVIARLDTQRSYFQYKSSVQDMVKGVIEAYWNLVLARTEMWSRQIKLEQAEEAYKREEARKAAGLAAISDVAQSKVTYNQFRANLIAARANVLAREGALRNILGIPPSDHLEIVPDSAPTSRRYRAVWEDLVQLAEQRRPEIVELKLVLEADQVRLFQAENFALPKLDLSSLYRWNGLAGEMPNGERIASRAGQFTDWSVSINFSVPLGLREGRARVRQQSLILERDRANLQQALHKTVHDLAIIIRDLDSAYEQYLAFKETRVAALENLRVQIEQFNFGRNIYLNVLQALNDWGDAVNAEAQTLTQYNIALAALEQTTGTILETHGLIFAEERFRAAGPLGCLCPPVEYPAALPPQGEPTRYPSTNQPGENAFDLTRPQIRGSKYKDQKPQEGPPLTLPPPRLVPTPLPRSP